MVARISCIADVQVEETSEEKCSKSETDVESELSSEVQPLLQPGAVEANHEEREKFEERNKFVIYCILFVLVSFFCHIINAFIRNSEENIELSDANCQWQGFFTFFFCHIMLRNDRFNSCLLFFDCRFGGEYFGNRLSRTLLSNKA